MSHLEDSRGCVEPSPQRSADPAEALSWREGRRWARCNSSGSGHILVTNLNVPRSRNSASLSLGPRLSFAPPSLRRSIFGVTSGSRSEEHTSDLQSLMRISYAVFGLQKKNQQPYYLN